MRTWILPALLAAGVPALAAAPEAPAQRRRMVSIGFGLVEPVSKVHFGGGVGGGSADNGDLGVGLGAQYVHFLTPRLGAGLEADYVTRDGTLSTRLYPAADASVRGDTWLMLALLRYSFLRRGAATPFVLLGAGGAWNKTTVDVKPSEWADTGTRETRRLIDDAAWTPAASARLGVDLDLDAAGPGFVTLEAGWTGLAHAGYAETPRGRALGLEGIRAPLSLLSFTARYSLRF
ncbi:MAG: hypothetical protein Q8T11_11645 [Elusimicrobiota bacterium]|nr:hypothetical protein [Elusimicrobiota bacterium]